jgi:hypothetical protein
MAYFSWRFAAVFAALLASSIPCAAQVEVTSCGQVVTGKAFLSADLDCTGYTDEVVVPEFVGKGTPATVPGAAVIVSRKGTLDLGGHTIVGGIFGVYCAKSCTISGGGGTITGATVHGVVANKNLTISDTTVSDNEQTALYAQGVLKVSGCLVSGSEYGTWFPRKAKLVDTTVTGNEEYGVAADAITLIDATVTGSGIDDLVAERKPKLKRSTCGTSSWGDDHLDVCAQP